jgi:hypothetical protein
MPTAKCSVCGAAMEPVETRTVWHRELVGPEMAYVEETRTCVDGHIILSLRNEKVQGLGRPVALTPGGFGRRDAV